MLMMIPKKIEKSKNKFRSSLVLMMVVFLAGCASAQMTARNPYTGPQFSRPNQIVVQAFSSDLNDVPANSPLRSQLADLNAVPSAEQAGLSQALGVQIAAGLAEKLNEMGMKSVRATSKTVVQPGDLVLRGYFLSLDEGSAAQRMALGFGSGAADLKVAVEGYRMTAEGLQFLGSGEGKAGSGKTPGGAVSLGIAIATANPVGLVVSSAVKAAGEASGKQTLEGASERITKLIASKLEEAFQRQGWIE